MPLNKKDVKKIKETMIEAIEPFMNAIQKDFNKQDRKTDKIEKKVTDIKVEQEAMFAKLVSLDRRVMYIEDRLTEIVKENKKEFARIKKDLAELKKQRKIKSRQLLSLEKRVEKLELKAV